MCRCGQEKRVAWIVTAPSLDRNDVGGIEHLDHVRAGHDAATRISAYCFKLKTWTAVSALHLCEGQIAGHRSTKRFVRIDLNREHLRRRVSKLDKEDPRSVICIHDPSLADLTSSTMLSHYEDEQPKSLRVLHALYFIGVCCRSTRCAWVVIDDAILVEIVGIVASGMQYADGHTRRHELASAAEVSPDSSLAAIYTGLVEGRWREIGPLGM